MMKNRKGTKDLCYLSELKKGEKAVIENIEVVEKIFRQRLFEMGITQGVVVKIKKIAPLGDPVGIEIRGYELCVIKNELKKILAKVVK